jgi:multiple antibiotic resistance protein
LGCGPCYIFAPVLFYFMFSFLLSSYISLLSLINPLGGIPVFLSLTAQHPANWVKKQILKTSLNVFVICVVSYLIGNYVLEFFGISINALKIAGGIIIARSGFQLLSATHKKDIGRKIQEESLHKEDISFTPLAMPLLSGPGSISFLINLSIQTDHQLSHSVFVLLAILLVSLSIWIILMLAPKILQYMGQAGLKAMSKIMGFIVLSIGIQLIISSLISIVGSLKL